MICYIAVIFVCVLLLLERISYQFVQIFQRFKDETWKWRKNDGQPSLPAQMVMEIQFQFVVQDSRRVCANFQT
jgi:hypothetical protein